MTTTDNENKNDSLKIIHGSKNPDDIEKDYEHKNDENIPLTQTYTDDKSKNGNGLNITIGVDLAPMMRMVVVMMVMKLVEVVGNFKKEEER